MEKQPNPKPILVDEFQIQSTRYRLLITPSLYAKTIAGVVQQETGVKWQNVVLETSTQNDLLTGDPVWTKITAHPIINWLTLTIAKNRKLIPDE